jgi:AsmA protein
MDISFWIQMSGNTWQKNLQSMQGQFHNRGKNLLVKRVDIDELIKRFEKTQNFNLLDVGAFVFAGPAGAAFTKSVDYANLLKRNSGDSTLINDFIAEIEIEEGIASVEDMAFSTQKNRIIFGGKIDLINQSFTDFIIAIVDDNGCIIISKKLNGPFDKPVLEKFSAISTVLAPVINAYNSIVGKECTPFYTGEITHPH